MCVLSLLRESSGCQLPLTSRPRKGGLGGNLTCVPCRVTIQWTTQTPAWKNLKDELPVWLPSMMEQMTEVSTASTAGAWMGRGGEGVRARLPRPGCGLCARKLTLSHLSLNRGKGSLQEVNFRLTVRTKEQQAEPQGGHHC